MPTRHKDLADLVGASRPRVTEFLIQFARDHLIARDESRLIVRRDRLESFLSPSFAPYRDEGNPVVCRNQ